MDAQRASEQGVVPLAAAHHDKLPRLGQGGDFRGLGPEKINAGQDLFVGKDRSKNLLQLITPEIITLKLVLSQISPQRLNGEGLSTVDQGFHRSPQGIHGSEAGNTLLGSGASNLKAIP